MRLLDLFCGRFRKVPTDEGYKVPCRLAYGRSGTESRSCEASDFPFYPTHHSGEILAYGLLQGRDALRMIHRLSEDQDTAYEGEPFYYQGIFACGYISFALMGFVHGTISCFSVRFLERIFLSNAGDLNQAIESRSAFHTTDNLGQFQELIYSST